MSEAEAIINATKQLDLTKFKTLADVLANAFPGKVLVCGVGKSAIAARKIAATFATCTIPAIFIDPIGLFHGELGAISPNDVALLISHSGDTEELVRLIPHLQAKGVVVMAIVGNCDSRIGRLPLALGTGVKAEAFARIPTASFAATVALGDALAVFTAQLKGVDQAELASNHPGGTIGLQEFIER